MKYDVCVLGLGYIGLPTASILAAKGLKVLGTDIRAEVVDTINRGELHFHEPDLDVLMRAAVHSGGLQAGRQPQPADCFIIAVPTPVTHAGGGDENPDLSYVEQAARSIAPVVRPGNLVILESTSPVGTTGKVRDWVREERAMQAKTGKAESEQRAEGILFAHCPERVLPGQLLKELVANDRIVGGLTAAAGEAARQLYQRFCTGEIFVTDARTAEMVKLAENAFRDVNIAFANELSLICERLGIDVWELIRLANRHPRVKILQPGPGVGGHCIAVDPWFIVHSAPDLARLIRTARAVNDSKPRQITTQVEQVAAGIARPVVACLGLAFKANVEDLRESPSVVIVQQLARNPRLQLLAVEPHVTTLPPALSGLPNVRLAAMEEALASANIVVLLVDHQKFKMINPSALAGKVIIDTRGFWRRHKTAIGL